MSNVQVWKDGKVVVAMYSGRMCPNLLDEANSKIERAVAEGAELVLYHTSNMDDPSMGLALQMRRFNERIKSAVSKTATVTQSTITAYLARFAFGLSRNHRVFFRDSEAALSWLRS